MFMFMFKANRKTHWINKNWTKNTDKLYVMSFSQLLGILQRFAVNILIKDWILDCFELLTTFKHRYNMQRRKLNITFKLRQNEIITWFRSDYMIVVLICNKFWFLNLICRWWAGFWKRISQLSYNIYFFYFEKKASGRRERTGNGFPDVSFAD